MKNAGHCPAFFMRRFRDALRSMRWSVAREARHHAHRSCKADAIRVAAASITSRGALGSGQALGL
ncbi:hypothetical protein WIW49_07405 [Xanthomonas euroxanthea]